jgi:iron complex outermembrane recepter protein
MDKGNFKKAHNNISGIAEKASPENKKQKPVMKMKKGLWVAGIAFLAWSVGAPSVIAQTESKQEEFTLEEITVTAQRRTENLQITSIAATAILGDALDDKAISNLVDLQFAAPSLTITDGMLSQSVNIRGIGLASGSPAVTNGVATYVDGVFQPPIGGTGTYFDIQDVEVLRGPQGTFVGSNSTGGAIFTNSKNPSFNKVEGYGNATLGNHGAKGLQAAVNTPLNDIFALRFAGNYSYHDPYYTDIGPFHNEPGGLDEKSGRISARLQTNRFEALLKLSESVKDTGGYAAQPLDTLKSGKDIYTVNYNDPEKNKEKGQQGTLRLDVTLPGDINLRSISGYQNKRAWNLYDLDGSATAKDSQDQYVRERVYTEEINLISPTDGVIDWIVGVYYQKNKIDLDIDQPTITIVAANDKVTRGLFGQIGYKLTSDLKLTVGMRYSDYEVSQEGAITLKAGMAFPGSPPILLGDAGGGHKDSKPTGKIGLDWDVNKDNLLYVFAARGYKSGGAVSRTLEFRPETVWDYETGWKSTLLNGRLRTQTNVFYMDYKDFQTDVLNPRDGMVSTTNVSDGTIKGFEFSAQAQLNALGFDLGYSYVDSKLGEVNFIDTRKLGGAQTYPSCDYVEGGIPGVTCTDYSNAYSRSNGGDMLYSPRQTFNAGIDYTFELTGDITLRPRINFSYIGDQWTTLAYDPAQKLLARKLLSAQITLNGQHWRDKYDWNIELYGTNLADENYVAGYFINAETYGQPREIGLRASFKF